MCIIGINGQSLISSATHTLSTDSHSFNGSIGEPLTITLSSKDKIQTQGFHQPDKMGVMCRPCDLIFDVPDSSTDDGLDMTISPNPTHSFINIDVNTAFNSTELKLAIFNTEGKVLLLGKGYNGSEFLQQKIDLSNFKSGFYYLRIYNAEQSITQSFNIIH